MDVNTATPRNSHMWMADVDTTFFPIATNSGGPIEGISLVSPLHVLWAKHVGGYEAGNFHLFFQAADGTKCQRTLVAWANHPTLDVSVGLLDSPVPAGVQFVKVLPRITLPNPHPTWRASLCAYRPVVANDTHF